MRGAQRRVAQPLRDELELEAVGVREAQRALVGALARMAVLAQAVGPEAERRGRRDGELQRVDVAEPGAAAGRAGELEPGEDRARRACSSPK